jgi:hypothetical protein
LLDRVDRGMRAKVSDIALHMDRCEKIYHHTNFNSASTNSPTVKSKFFDQFLV